MANPVDLDKHEPDALDRYIDKLTPEQLKTSQVAAARTRFLELGSFIAMQASVITDLECRLKDVESLAHSHPKATSPILEALNAINATLRRIERREFSGGRHEVLGISRVPQAGCDAVAVRVPGQKPRTRRPRSR